MAEEDSELNFCGDVISVGVTELYLYFIITKTCLYVYSLFLLLFVDIITHAIQSNTDDISTSLLVFFLSVSHLSSIYISNHFYQKFNTGMPGVTFYQIIQQILMSMM